MFKCIKSTWHVPSIYTMVYIKYISVRPHNTSHLLVQIFKTNNINKTNTNEVLARIWGNWNSCYSCNSCYLAQNVKWYNCCGNQFDGFLKVKRRIALCFSNSTPKYVLQRNESRDSNRYSHANV